jgi:hypothetical protein
MVKYVRVAVSNQNIIQIRNVLVKYSDVRYKKKKKTWQKIQ